MANRPDSKNEEKLDNITVTTAVNLDTVGASVASGNHGDLSLSGSTWSINTGAVTLPKMSTVATGTLLGRATSGTGAVEQLTIGTGLSVTGTTLNVTSGVDDGDKGDIVVSSSGATWTIDTGVISLDKLAPLATARLIGRASSGTGSAEALTIGSGLVITGTTLSAPGVSDGDKGDITVSGSGATWTIDAGSVTLAKMANIATSRLIGRASAGAGVPEEITLGSGLTLTGTTLSASGGGGPGITDGDKGDITVSSAGLVWTIDNAAVSYGKLQNVSSTDRVLGRSSAGAGTVEEIICTAFGRSLLDDADSVAGRATLGLGTLAVQSGTFSGTSSGTNTGDQTITLSGAVTGSGTGAITTTLPNDSVTYAKLQNVSATNRLLGRITAGAGDAEEVVIGTGLAVVAGALEAGGQFTEVANKAARPSTPPDGARVRVLTNRLVYVRRSGAWEIDNYFVTVNQAQYDALTELEDQQFVLLATGSVYKGYVYTTADGLTQVFATASGVADGDYGNISIAAGVWSIDNGVVTLAKMADLATSRLIGRATAGTGVPEAITIGSGLSLTGTTLSATGGGGVSDGDKGDITVSASGATWTIDNDSVTYAKLQNVSATDMLLGRSTAGAGDVEEVPCTAFGRSLLDDVNAAAGRATLGLGTLAVQSGTFSGTSSGTNTGDQTITLTGDVTGAGTGSFAATIAADAVTYAKLQNVSATNRLLGRASAGAGDVEEVQLGSGLSYSGTTLNYTPPAGSLTLAMHANVTASRLLGRDASGAGAPQELTIGSGLSLSGTTLSATGGGVTDGDKGDIVVSGSGATWLIDSGATPTLAQLTVATASANTTSLAITGYSLTGANAQSAVSVTGTLNTTGAPDIVALNITNTASATTTKLLNFKVNGASCLTVSPTGSVTFGPAGARRCHIGKFHSSSTYNTGIWFTDTPADNTYAFIASNASLIIGSADPPALEFRNGSSANTSLSLQVISTVPHLMMPRIARFGWSNGNYDQSTYGNVETGFDRPDVGVLRLYNFVTPAGAALEMVERTAPAAPPADGMRQWCEDNGSGKTRWMCQFGSGAAIQIAIQP